MERSPKPGVALLQILEERSLYGEGNCEILRKALETIGMNRVAVILQPCGKTFDPQELTGTFTGIYLKSQGLIYPEVAILQPCSVGVSVEYDL